MLFEIKHYPCDYKKVAVKLWFLKLQGRVTKQRKSLTFLVVISLITLSLINMALGLLFLILILIVLIADFIISISAIKSKVTAIENYLINGGEEIWVYAGDYLCYIQDDIEFKKVDWSDLYEYCRIDNPSSISLRNKLTKEVHVFYESEFPNDDFLKFKKIVESNIKVIPLY